MASDYGLNFGFRRSDEIMAIREGRLMVPANASNWRQGWLVKQDTAAPGFLALSLTADLGVSGLWGLLVQEEDHIDDIYSNLPGRTSSDFGIVKPGRLAIMWGGVGTKVWMKNTPAQTRADGRSIAAVTMFTASGLAVGDGLTFTGATTKLWVESATAGEQFLRITQVDLSVAGSEYLEAVIVK